MKLLVRWPDKSQGGTVSNEIVQHHDWLSTVLAMTGDPDIVEKSKKGHRAIGWTYKDHIDGFNLLPYPTGQEKKSPRNMFVCLSDGRCARPVLRQFEGGFMEQRCTNTMQGWAEPFTRLRLPKFFNLRTGPYERADITSTTYYQWSIRRAYIPYGARTAMDILAATFKDFPPVQHPNCFTTDEALKMLTDAAGGAKH